MNQPIPWRTLKPSSRGRRRSVRWLGLSLAMLLVCAGVAGATDGGLTGGTETSPKPSTPVDATVNIYDLDGGAFSSELEIIYPTGFTSSGLNSVTALCSPAQGAAGQCPAASMVGVGTVNLTNAQGQAETAPVTLSLGEPSQAEDIGTVYVDADLNGAVGSAAAQFLPDPPQGPELLVTNVAEIAPAGTSVAGLSVTLGATHTVTSKKTVVKIVGRGKHRRRKRVTETVRKVSSLLINPSTCTGVWAGEVAATIGLASDQGAFTFNCQLPSV